MSFRKFIHNNIVAIVIIPIIIGSHWFVNKIAEDESLVKPDERKDLPIVQVSLLYFMIIFGYDEH